MPDQPRILVVDDNPATLYATSRVLRGAGFEVMEASSGADALRLATPDVALVVLDINLPDFDGYAVCRRLRDNTDTSAIPVIYLSASFVSDLDKVIGLEAGAEGYLTHPVEPPVLIATVNAFLRTHQAEAAKRQSEAKFRAVFEQALNGIALISADWIYLEANPALCAFLGRRREEIVGKHTSGFLPGGEEGRSVEIADSVRRTGHWSGVFPLVRADGRQVELEWNISRLDEAGEQLAIIGDITERRMVESERERLLQAERSARAAAERASRAKDEFLANLSHELRTPLNTIIGWSQLLRDGALAPGEVTEALAVIERNAKIQAALIGDMLDVARIASGKLRLEPETVDPVWLITAAMNSLVPAAEAKGVTLRRSLNPATGALFADPGRLQQVVVNLINNAIKFTPAGGTVEVLLRRASGRIEIEVRDNGGGIAPEFLPHLFQRFQQEDTGTRKSHSGLGLGLAIVKHLTDLHSGTVTAWSAGLGQGSSFIVSLPRTGGALSTALRQGPRNAETHLPPASPRLTGLRVLVVDDDADSRSFLRRLLEECRAEVVEAATVPAALESLEPFRPQLLVSDIGMPLEDGYDLIRRVRAAGWSAERLPAIALTAYARSEDRDQSLRAGFQAHLPKPLNPRDFIAVTVRLAEGHHPTGVASGAPPDGPGT